MQGALPGDEKTEEFFPYCPMSAVIDGACQGTISSGKTGFNPLDEMNTENDESYNDTEPEFNSTAAAAEAGPFLDRSTSSSLLEEGGNSENDGKILLPSANTTAAPSFEPATPMPIWHARRRYRTVTARRRDNYNQQPIG